MGETVFETAVREVREETGLAIKPTAVLTVVDSVIRDASECVQFHYTIVEIEAEWRLGEPVGADDALDAAWVGVDDVARMVSWGETDRIVRLSAARRGNL